MPRVKQLRPDGAGVLRACQACKAEFYPRSKAQRYCSRSCINRGRGQQSVSANMRRCSRCKDIKTEAEFYKRGNGLGSACKLCSKSHTRPFNATCSACGKACYHKTDRRRPHHKVYCSTTCRELRRDWLRWHRSAPLSLALVPRHLIECAQCSAKFYGHQRQRYCSSECGAAYTKAQVNAANQARPIEERRQVGLRPCCQCGALFYAEHGKAVICSSRCRNKRWPSAKWHRAISLVALAVRDGGKCHICARSVSQEDASADHLVPQSLGGSHEPSNLALAHRRCNSRRGAGRIPAQLRLG